jgi:hypothetical protein
MSLPLRSRALSVRRGPAWRAVLLVGPLLVGRGLAQYRVRDGIILGATVGLGFGAFEAAGYSLSYSVQSGAFSARDLVSEELLRAAVVLTVLLKGSSQQRSALGFGTVPSPDDVGAQVLLGALQWSFMFLIAAFGVWLVRRRWRVVE